MLYFVDVDDVGVLVAACGGVLAWRMATWFPDFFYVIAQVLSSKIEMGLENSINII